MTLLDEIPSLDLADFELKNYVRLVKIIMQKKYLFFLFLSQLGMNLFAQNKGEKAEILLENNHYWDAEILESTTDSLQLKINDKYILTIARSAIKSIETKTKIYTQKRTRNKELFPNYQFLQSNTNPIPKGELQYGNSYLLFHQLSYGMTSNFSMNVMAYYVPKGLDIDITKGMRFVINPQYYFKLSNSTNLCLGVLYHNMNNVQENSNSQQGLINFTFNTITSKSKFSMGIGSGYDLKAQNFSDNILRPQFSQLLQINLLYGRFISQKALLYSELYHQNPLFDNVLNSSMLTFCIKKEVNSRFVYTYGIGFQYLSDEYDKFISPAPMLGFRYKLIN